MVSKPEKVKLNDDHNLIQMILSNKFNLGKVNETLNLIKGGVNPNIKDESGK